MGTGAEPSILIDDPAEADSAWLERALAAAGRPTKVRDLTCEPVGTGQMGSSFRLSYTDSDDLTRRSSVVLKLPTDDEVRRAMSAPAYRSELTFYRHIAASTSARVPRCDLAVGSSDGTRFTLLLEDLAPAVQGDQIAGCGVDVLIDASENLARLHAAWWNHAFDDDELGLKAPGPEEIEFMAAIYASAVGTFLERFGDKLADDDARVLRDARVAIEAMLRVSTPLSVIHGDYRLDNLMFFPSGEVATVDWQTTSVGMPARDLAFLVATSLDPTEHAVADETITDAYHRALASGGVTDYTLEDCREDYRLGMMHCAMIVVLGAAYGVPTERGDEMFTVMARRAAQAIRDLDSIGVALARGNA